MSSHQVKWDSYYKVQAPFDSGRPSSQLVQFITSCPAGGIISNNHRKLTEESIAGVAAYAELVLPPSADDTQGRQPHFCERCSAFKPPPGGCVLELGCGTGASSRWLAQQGFRVTAIDISPVALTKAAAAAAAAGLPPDNPHWLLQDIMQLGPTDRHGCGSAQLGEPTAGNSATGCSVATGGHTESAGVCYDFIYDCQVYHVLVRDQTDCQELLPHSLFNLLSPGGVLMILAGNANEAEIGPNTLTAQQLLLPLLSAGLQLVMLQQTRFDSTEYYDKVLGKRPLAWCAVLQRPRQNAPVE